MKPKRHPRVVNVDEVEVVEQSKGRFAPKARRLGGAAGARQVGCSWIELERGKTAFPYHYHTGIEEGLFILSGTGELRIGKDKVTVRSGDYVAFPAGPEYAHSLTNTGKEPLRYLALSNQNTTDIIGYPDSKKFAFGALPDPATWPEGMWVQKMVRDEASVDYYEGEDVGPEC